jgi:hypothetical protein
MALSFNVITRSVIMLSIAFYSYYADCHYAERRMLSVVAPSLQAVHLDSLSF